MSTRHRQDMVRVALMGAKEEGLTRSFIAALADEVYGAQRVVACKVLGHPVAGWRRVWPEPHPVGRVVFQHDGGLWFDITLADYEAMQPTDCGLLREAMALAAAEGATGEHVAMYSLNDDGRTYAATLEAM